jgi:hypothetical protein
MLCKPVFDRRAALSLGRQPGPRRRGLNASMCVIDLRLLTLCRANSSRWIARRRLRAAQYAPRSPRDRAKRGRHPPRRPHPSTAQMRALHLPRRAQPYPRTGIQGRPRPRPPQPQRQKRVIQGLPLPRRWRHLPMACHPGALPLHCWHLGLGCARTAPSLTRQINAHSTNWSAWCCASCVCGRP